MPNKIHGLYITKKSNILPLRHYFCSIKAFVLINLKCALLLLTVPLALRAEVIQDPPPGTAEALLLKLQTCYDEQIELAEARLTQIGILREQIFNAAAVPQQKKILEARLKTNQTLLQTFTDRAKSCQFVMGEIRQLQFMSNLQQEEALKTIRHAAQKVLDHHITFEQLVRKYPLGLFAQAGTHYLPSDDCQRERSKDGKILANAYVPFFSHTPPELEKHYIQSEFMETQIRLLQSGKKKFLEMRIDFQSSKAAQYYGIIEESSPMKLVFTDDDYIYLQNSVTTHPDFQSTSGRTSYKMQCALTRSDYQKIKKKLPDKLIIVWPSGAETYEIYRLHTLQNLAACLEKKI